MYSALIRGRCCALRPMASTFRLFVALMLTLHLPLWSTLAWGSASVAPASKGPPNPFIVYGPHGYRTFPHSRCQEVPKEDTVNLSEVEGAWNLVEHITSSNGKPTPPHAPYLCPEARVVWTQGASSINVSQISIEWPRWFKDVTEWVPHGGNESASVFYHEENIFSLWTMKVMEVVPDSHMLLFICIDYTIWPGWNHRGVYLLSRAPTLSTRVKRKLSRRAHQRMRMQYHRSVNTTVCDQDQYWNMEGVVTRWHPHRKFSPATTGLKAPVDPIVSRNHRRNLNNLD